MEDIFIRYLHFLGIMVIMATLVTEHLLLGKTVDQAQLKTLARVHLVYWLGVLVVLVAGLLLWLVVGKPATFYTTNGFFHAKLTLFVLMAIMGMAPGGFYAKAKKSQDSSVVVSKGVMMVLRTQLLLMLILPLLGCLIARGVGLGN
ncbi:DUF2214 family protein [Gallaecimonas mangrovi]|uniref:DUF2214 family protein n=1 Tax=Gallaecimonas mangrovi TaxID=2291597 RepID=UPI000E1FC50F|nr:DUF2214 family protein [Gallaecimonas mangrovi]